MIVGGAAGSSTPAARVQGVSMRLGAVVAAAAVWLVGLPVPGAAQPTEQPVTFAEHVAPILYERCPTWPGRCRC